MKQITCTVRYVSNAGLVLESGGERIGIDVFCQDPAGLYADTPEEIRQQLLQEIEDGTLQTLIFTHGHGDHFRKEDVLEAWRRNQSLCIISTEQVARELVDAGIANGQLMKAVRADGLPAGLWAIPDGEKEKQLRWITRGSFRIGFLNSLHEGTQYAQEQNLTLLLETADQHLVVPGDAAPRESLFGRIENWSERIDWFFLPFPYVGIGSTRKLLTEKLRIQGAFVLHQPRPEADAQNWVANAKRMCQRAKDGLPMPIFPEKLGDWWDLSGPEKLGDWWDLSGPEKLGGLVGSSAPDKWQDAEGPVYETKK